MTGARQFIPVAANDIGCSDLRMWNFLKSIVQIALMLLGLTGLVDNVVEWQGFTANIVLEYEKIRDKLFAVLPFELWDELKDYLVIGAVIASSYFRANLEDDLKHYSEFGWLYKILAIGMVLPVAMLIWPVIVIGASLLAFIPESINPARRREMAFLKQFATNTLMAFVAFIGVLFVASDALEKIFDL